VQRGQRQVLVVIWACIHEGELRHLENFAFQVCTELLSFSLNPVLTRWV